jgi:dienelactone hydrolase
VEVYISKPPNYPHSPSKLLLFLTSGTGIHSTNNQIQADRFASEGYLVLMPDMFASDPAPNTSAGSNQEPPTLIEQFKQRAAETAKSFLIDMWLARNTPEKILPIVQRVIEAAQEEFADAVANGGGIYGVGYCTGGRIILLLAGERPDTATWGQKRQSDEEAGPAKKGPFIKAGAIAHASLVVREDFDGVKVPLTFACVNDDPLFASDVREHGEKALQAAAVEAEFKGYEGVPHGEFLRTMTQDQPPLRSWLISS